MSLRPLLGVLVVVAALLLLGCSAAPQPHQHEVQQLAEAEGNAWQTAYQTVSAAKIEAQARVGQEIAENSRIEGVNAAALTALKAKHANEVATLHAEFFKLMRSCNGHLRAWQRARAKVKSLQLRVDEATMQVAASDAAIEKADDKIAENEAKEPVEAAKVPDTVPAMDAAKEALDDAKAESLNADGSGKPADSAEAQALEAAQREYMEAYAAHQEAKQRVIDAQWGQKAGKTEKAAAETMKTMAQDARDASEAAKATAEGDLETAHNQPGLTVSAPSSVLSLLMESAGAGADCSDDNQSWRCKAQRVTAERDTLFAQTDHQVDVVRPQLHDTHQILHDAEVARHEAEITDLRARFVKVANLCQRKAWQTNVIKTAHDKAKLAQGVAQAKLDEETALLTAANTLVADRQQQLSTDQGTLSTAEATLAAAELAASQGTTSANLAAVSNAGTARNAARTAVASSEQSKSDAEVAAAEVQGRVDAAQATLDAANSHPQIDEAETNAAMAVAAEGRCFHGDCEGAASGLAASV